MSIHLFAQEPGGAPQGGVASPYFPMLLIGLMVIFWLVVVLPASRRQRKEQEKMLATLKRGAKVVTSAGIIGTVVSVKDNEDEITLRSEDSRIKVLRSSVLRVLGSDEVEAGK
jgi:preprotein translocase subunit YajC